MVTQNEYVMQQLHKDAYDRIYQEAKKQRMLRQAGFAQPRLRGLFCSAAGSVGRALVAIGKRLERVEKSASLPAAARMASIENL